MLASRRPKFIASLVWFHRWLGIATCLIFAMWFASGAVMLFKPFPSLSAAERLALVAPLDVGSIRISPSEALQAAEMPTPSAIRLIQRLRAPVYVVEADGRSIAIDAANGRVLPNLPPEAVGADSSPIYYDQWIVPNGIDPFRPVYRLPQHDSARTELYVSAITGEPVQRTTAADRAWNWVGSVLHWIYFTPLRSDWAAWDQTVWWISLVATLVALAGITLGVLRALAAIRLKRGSLTYFRARWMRWHHLLGLFVGLFVLTWIVSGWLSMDHGRLFSRGEATPAQARAFAGDGSLEQVSAATFRQMGAAKQISFSSLGGMPMLSVTRPGGAVDRLDAAGRALTDQAISQRVAAAIENAWPGARLAGIEPVAPTNLLRLHEGWPDSVRRAQLAGGAYPDLYFDSDTGRLLTVMDRSRENYAWAYYALHTFKFPGLAGQPTLRKSLVLILLAAGFLFSLTGAVIGWRRLRRTWNPVSET